MHELSHAFHLENRIENNEFDFIEPKVFKAYTKFADQEIARIRNGEKSFFRSYAGTNFHEFFAVSVETFFELTDEFEAYNSELFKCLSTLLKQDRRSIRLRDKRI